MSLGLDSRISASLCVVVARRHGLRAVGKATAPESNPMFFSRSRAVWLESLAGSAAAAEETACFKFPAAVSRSSL
eukprot:8007357-Pyramimonas_sp.AAC.1